MSRLPLIIGLSVPVLVGAFVINGLLNWKDLSPETPPQVPDISSILENSSEGAMGADTALKAITPVNANDDAVVPKGDILVIEVAGASSGTIEIQLLPDLAPEHVARIKALASAGEYDNVVFHRVISGFMAQTGDVEFGDRTNGATARAGTGASSQPDLKAEFSDAKFLEGVVGMARSQSPDSANSQFFIMFDAAPFLDGQYTIVGRVIKGQEVVNAIKKGSQSANGAVQDPDYMKKVSIR